MVMFINRQVLEQMYTTSGQMPSMLLILSITHSILQVHMIIAMAVFLLLFVYSKQNVVAQI